MDPKPRGARAPVLVGSFPAATSQATVLKACGSNVARLFGAFIDRMVELKKLKINVRNERSCTSQCKK
ncbi:hypothetical protein EMIT0357P_40338 [Pseudomonas marginalis]